MRVRGEEDRKKDGPGKLTSSPPRGPWAPLALLLAVGARRDAGSPRLSRNPPPEVASDQGNSGIRNDRCVGGKGRGGGLPLTRCGSQQLCCWRGARPTPSCCRATGGGLQQWSACSRRAVDSPGPGGAGRFRGLCWCAGVHESSTPVRGQLLGLPHGGVLPRQM